MSINYEEFKSITSGKIKVGPNKMVDGIEIEWVVGGQSGGSCWDTDRHVYFPKDADPEPEFKQLDSILAKVCPNITYLEYKRLAATVVQTYDYCYNDYYGNYTEYRKKYVVLEDLYNYLLKESLLSNVN